jgi:3-methylfumaryl-CoA hydratase
MMDIALDELRRWIGRKESRSERLAAAPANLLAATLDTRDPGMQDGMALPPLYHWVYFLPVCRQSDLDQDGHPARGGFLPPIPLPRRMWAAGTIEFTSPLIIGETATRTSEVTDVTLKRGRSGALVFLKLRHTITQGAGVVVLTETQDLVYRNAPDPSEAAAPADPGPGPRQAQPTAWMRKIVPDPTLLFRYSALTFNSHRIHYDRPYAMDVERYPALVVHGPLIATLLVDHLLREIPAARLRRFAFRAQKPLFDGAPFLLCAAPETETAKFRLWSCDGTGACCTEASATVDRLDS